MYDMGHVKSIFRAVWQLIYWKQLFIFILVQCQVWRYNTCRIRICEVDGNVISYKCQYYATDEETCIRWMASQLYAMQNKESLEINLKK
jgi:hypothetical protein